MARRNRTFEWMPSGTDRIPQAGKKVASSRGREEAFDQGTGVGLGDGEDRVSGGRGRPPLGIHARSRPGVSVRPNSSVRRRPQGIGTSLGEGRPGCRQRLADGVSWKQCPCQSLLLLPVTAHVSVRTRCQFLGLHRFCGSRCGESVQRMRSKRNGGFVKSSTTL